MTDRTFLNLVRQRAEAYRDKAAFDYCRYFADGEQHSQLTFGELDTRARSVALVLQQMGATGERALVLCPSGLDFIVAFFGCIYAGAVPVPVHPPARARVIGRVASIVQDTQARFTVTTAETQAKFQSAIDEMADGPAMRWCAVDDIAASADEWVAPDIDPDDTAMLQYTSGSTGSPKGVVVSHRNLLSNVEAIRTAWGGGNDRAKGVFWLPLHHDMGLIGGILTSIYVGATSYFMPPESFIERPMRWLEAIAKHGGTITAAPNFAYQLCVDLSTPEERAALDLSTMTTAMCGAEPIRAATLQRFVDAFAPAGFQPHGFAPVYGMAESTLLVSGKAEQDRTAPIVRYLDSDALRDHRVVPVAPGSPEAASFVACGQAQPNHEAVIVDPATGRRCADDEVGEIWLTGGSVAQGYWGKPAETAETFNAFLADTGRGPFLRTGDLGFHLDGELFVSGRLKDLIVIRGRNHYPEDIEATVQDSHDALLRGRGAAFSITPDSDAGEQLVIVQEVDRYRAGDMDADEALAAIRTAVTEHHEIRPHAIILTEPSTIPTTSSGKIRRNRSRQRFLDGDLASIAQWREKASGAPRHAADAERGTPGAGELAAWLATQLADMLDIPATEIDTSLPFAHYGLDSVRAVRLTATLAEHVGQELSPTLPYEYPTIDALCAHLTEDVAAEPAARVAEPRTVAADEPIAIIGIGCRFPGADGPAAFWEMLAEGRDAVIDIPPERWTADPNGVARGGFLDQVDQFDAKFFNISPREAARIDPQQRLLLEVAWEALEDAGQPTERLAGSPTGVFVGVSTYDYGSLQFGRPDLIDAYSGTGGALSIAANRLSYALDLRGPSMAIDTACSSSLVAVHQACRSLRDGESTLAIAGGVNVILSPALGLNFSKATLMAADGRCKTFDAAADGYVRGEGAGVVVLKPLSQALTDGDRIYAVLRGSATNHDGRTNGLTAPSRHAQEAVLTEAYRRAGLSPSAVQYVEAHGTGTALGDTIEANALGAILADGRTPDSPCLIGSVKTNIGHLEAAAGMAGLIKTALALQHREIPPSLNFDQPNPHIPFERLALKVADVRTPWPLNNRRAVAGVSSFGFGGTNAHVVMTEAPEVRAPQSHGANGRVELLPLSARSPEALSGLATRYERALLAGMPPTDLSYTAGARRDHHDYRLAVLGRNAAELSESLAAYRRGESRPGWTTGRRRPGPGTVFVFSGQGSQWRGMGRQLHAEEEVFRDALTECDRAMRPHLGASVLDALLAGDTLDDIGLIQPALFAMQVALAALWRSWGVEPAAVIGHSMGEAAAAHVAGALTLDDAARVICARARLLRGAARGGAMISAELSRAEADELIGGRKGRVVVAASNSVRSTVLSGDSDVLSELMSEIQRRDRFCRWVDVDVASHSPRMDALRDDLAAALTGVRPSAPTTPMYSTVTGEPVDGAALDAAYWVENLCSPVRFSAAARRLFERDHEVFLEASPHPVLLSALREDAEDLGRACTLVPSMRRDQGGRDAVLASLGVLYASGQSVVWDRLHPRGARLVSAPTYPWQRERFWLDMAATGHSTVADRSPWRGPIRSSTQPTAVICEIDVGTELFPILSDHRVQDEVVVPGATLLELAVTGAARAFVTPRMPRDVAFHRSLILDGAQSRTVQLVLRGEPSGPVSFELHSMDPTPSLLAAGALDAGEPNVEVHNPDDIRNRCTERISGTAFYSRLAQHGLQYGPAFQKVTDVWRRDGEAIAQLSPGDAGDFDAAVLDGCFQTLAATLPASNGHSHDTYLPIGVADLRVRGSFSDGVWCHARLRDGTEGDVYLLDRTGKVLTAVHGLRLKKLADSAASAEPSVRGDLYELRWEAAQLSERNSAGMDNWLIFGDGGTTTDRTRKLLEQRSQTCFLVEAGSDFERLTSHHYRLDPAQPQQFRRLLDDLPAPLQGVVYLWGLMDSMESTRVLGPTGVLHLVQALTASQRSPRLWLVTQGAQPVEAATDVASPAQAPLWGMGRSIGHEHPELRCSRVDLPIHEQPEDLAALVEEFLADAADTDVAFRSARRYVARMTPLVVAAETVAPRPDSGFRMEYSRPGVLDDIDTRAVARRTPASDEVEIQVRATGLNFIDVMRALGVYPGQEAGPTQIGVECSGVVTAVGHDVDDVRIGDAVIALTADGVGSFLTTPADLVAPKPVELSFEQAATIPIAYLTAYYALHEQARLRRGERVLIHSAAGGVGLAAVEVARWLNATVLGTAGTPEKRDYLHGLGMEHVFDSRSLGFADRVLAATGGEGVDVVLNSLSGEAIPHSLDALSRYGRFLEIGKTDIYGQGRLQMWQLRNNASYIVIDLAQLIVDRPAYVGALLRDVVAHLEQGAFRPLPVRSFPAAKTSTALRTLAQGKQIGKLVVSVDRRQAAHHEKLPAQFEPNATYLVTGGLGGIGLATASWMVERGARHLVLLGRRPASEAGQRAIDELRANGSEVVYARGDVTQADQLASVLDSIRTTMPPLRGVVHAAGILDDGILARLDDRRLREVMAPKIDGAWNLHTLTRDAALDFFVLFSSAAALLGSPGQAHYAAGNAFLDALAWYRHAHGQPALSINWGPWAEVGLVNKPEQQRNLQRHGMIPIPVADGVQTLARLFRSSVTQVAVLRMNPSLAAGPADAPAPERHDDLRDALLHADENTRRRQLTSYLTEQAAGKLGLAPSQLDVESPLQQLGVDSLIAVELRAQIERDLGIVVPVVRLLDGPSVTGLAGFLVDQLSSTTGQPAPAETGNAPAVNGPNGADPQWMDVLGRLPDISDDDVDALLRDVLAAREGDDDG